MSLTQPHLLPPAIEPARVRWRDDQPESDQFGDIYFSRDNGLEEARYVFLQHNALETRFRKLKAGESFVVAESGFGTGLSFLAVWQLWRRCSPPPGAVLHFVSVECYPFNAADLARAHQLWPELSELASALLGQYPPLTRGLHRRLLDDSQVRLSLYFGDAVEGWNSMRFTADAWFLDGFAPAVNPLFWVEEVVDAVARHSKAGTTLATYTAVGRVRRALQAAGFTMRKPPGFGFKRNMLAGCFTPPCSSGDHTPAAVARTTPETVAIIGAGIAGCLLANNLARRGMKVKVIDADNSPGQGASGNSQGALYVKLGINYSPETALALSALLFSQAFYQPLAENLWFPTGLLQLAQDEKEQRRQARFLENNEYPKEIVRSVTAEQARALTGTNVTSGGLWFAGSGWLKPADFCQHLLQHPNIKSRWNSRISRLSRHDGQWQLTTEHDTLNCDHVVLCSGHETPSLLPEPDSYRLKTIRGQITQIASDRIHSPKAVICGQRFLNPASDGYCLTGATFDLRERTPEVTAQGHAENLAGLETMIKNVWQHERPPVSELNGRVGFRCTTHDYQPIAGELTDKDGTAIGITLFAGLGSKGLTLAPLLAEWLADCLSGQPEALTTGLQERVRTERCRTRNSLKS